VAYRFMLEVPEAERQAAEIEIGAVPETQIVVTRSSFAEGFDTPYAALTIAAENLRVIDTIYRWYGSRGGAQLDARLVLHSGERLSLADHTAGSMVAAIRSDQPWVEHSIPKIGDHAEEEFMAPSTAEQPALATTRSPRSVTINHLNFVAVSVMDLRRAEEFYTQFFDMQVVGRTRNDEDGKYRLVDDGYDWEQAIASETQADDTYLRNGLLTLALHRVGVGARLDRNIIDRISIQVDAASYNRLKARALVNSYELLGETQASFTFRDPFGVPWEITLPGLLPSILREALGS
jgi:catechol 2,3-dioxygenase-like lactoylglutathione lyase family enzyme